MKKTLIKVIVSFLVFVISLVGLGIFMNRDNDNMTMQMGEAQLPVINMIARDEAMGDIAYNQLHGYTTAMDTAYQRDTVTVLGTDREVSFIVYTYDQTIRDINVEVRGIDGRLVEDCEVTDLNSHENEIYASLTLKDLLDENTEYMLVILLDVRGLGTVRYYTRIIVSDNTYLNEKLTFVKWFHDALYDADLAREKNVTNYLESDATGDNSSFHKVNIHSSFNQITWGDMNVTQQTDPVIQLTEIASSTGGLVLYYIVSTDDSSGTYYYMVEESYELRYVPGAERIYLMRYDRTMTQIPDLNGDIYSQNGIYLGITDKDQTLWESESGNIVVFDAAGRLCSYDMTNNKVTVIFSFYDSDNGDERAMYDKHDMKALKVDDSGNVWFAVYGYMNRGIHEGEVDVIIYYFDSSTDTVEEILCISSDKSYEVLASDIENLLYLNDNGELYIYLEDTVWQIDLSSGKARAIAKLNWEGSIALTQSQDILAWQEGNDPSYCTELNLKDLESGEEYCIEAPTGNAVKLLGTIDNDIIYGMASISDIVSDSFGNTLFPMYQICICDSEGKLVKDKNTSSENIYFTNCTVTEGQINLDRIVFREDGSYEQMDEDYLVTNEEEQFSYNHLTVAASDIYENVVTLNTRSSVNTEAIQVRNPKQVIFEDNRTISVPENDNVMPKYYVYDASGLVSVFHNPADAILTANDSYGTVVDDNSAYIWRRGNLSERNQIMAITSHTTEENTDSLAVCLDTILNYEGTSGNSQYMLNRGNSAAQILESRLTDYTVLDLTGITLNSVLYYIDQDIPVLACLQNGEAVLITGFNSSNVVIMDPEKGTLSQRGINDSTQWFEENGNCFITYIRP